MASMVRRLLDLLGLDALHLLQVQRGLGTRRDNDERRKAIARSYRGDVEAFLDDLRQRDLLELLDRDYFLEGSLYRPPHLRSLRQDELLRIARKLFVKRQIPSDFERDDASHAFVLDATTSDDVESEDDRLPEPGPTAPGSPLVDGTESPPPEDDADDANGSTLFDRLSDEWSRPRKISSILRALDLDVPERLRTERFQEMIKLLAARGVQLQLVDGDVLGAADESPGIRAKVRARLLAGQAPGHSTRELAVAFALPGGATIGQLTCSWATAGAHLSTPDERLAPSARAAFEIVMRHIASDQPTADRLRACGFTLRASHFPQFSSFPRLPIALAMLGAATNKSVAPGLVCIGDLSPDGIISSGELSTGVLQLAHDAQCKLALVAAPDAERLSGNALPAIELLPAETLEEAAAFALQ